MLHSWLEPYRIVEKSSPVHFRLHTDTNKEVTFALHANRMKPFVDPSLKPIEPSLFDDPNQPDLDDSDIPKDRFAEELQGDRASPDISGDLSPGAPVLQSNEQPHKDLVDNETNFATEKILKHREVDGKK